MVSEFIQELWRCTDPFQTQLSLLDTQQLSNSTSAARTTRLVSLVSCIQVCYKSSSCRKSSEYPLLLLC